MEHQSPSPLLVDLYLEQARISGLSLGVEERRRLVDLLNAPDEALQLEAGRLIMVGGQSRALGKVAIEKRAIVVAVPRETQEQLRQRSIERSMGGRATTLPLEITVITPPFIVQGTAHLLAGRAQVKNRLRADPDLFPRFFSVTEGRLHLPDGSSVDAPVILVNRDCLVAVSQDRAA